ncbi:DUF4148 domain-containing protein [Glaciimonas sp. CA11.2]|uniref:DUF4148 domain-containing protein n=1 Tax=unclassified Glaciimonas TaxID=2644401 RepID=UPI002AB5A995|nr:MULTISPECIES: DUF4148 domain-containing protein [unclassified Glaciimonas]MDY7547714.1 DUF4148 domain-containing protein [Glaciimonas sp. CA11.2]MEB0012966.1 DUF4148 domain-containing protein [Glaciimonas sp. Cout2]MEB0082922.1 DUF4148 domain-containing protein [Glaciimonas sp. Gout2]MEB0161369.1 DUF4148 domain-containing protein [Glaciimonas sp. CA11.2]
MNAKPLIAGLIIFAAAAGSAFAEAPYPANDHSSSTKTRAQVIAELATARAQGLMDQSYTTYPILEFDKKTTSAEQ